MRLVHVFLGETDGVQHGLGGTLGDGLGDVARDLVEGGILLIAGDGGGEGATRQCIVNDEGTVELKQLRGGR